MVRWWGVKHERIEELARRSKRQLFLFVYGGQFTISTLLIKPNFHGVTKIILNHISGSLYVLCELILCVNFFNNCLIMGGQ